MVPNRDRSVSVSAHNTPRLAAHVETLTERSQFGTMYTDNSAGGVGLVLQAAIRERIAATMRETRAKKSACISDSSDAGECREECMGMSLTTYLPMWTSARRIWCMSVAWWVFARLRIVLLLTRSDISLCRPDIWGGLLGAHATDAGEGGAMAGSEEEEDEDEDESENEDEDEDDGSDEESDQGSDEEEGGAAGYVPYSKSA